jgi:hypothetical protein
MPEICLPRMHPGQRRIWDCPARYKVVSCGRRWGKSWFARIALSIEAARGKTVAYFAPTDKALTKMWAAMVAILAPITKKKNEQKKILYLLGGGELWFWSLENFETIRGGDYDFVVVDECCVAKKFREAWTEVIRPTLIDRAGHALFLSTPKGYDFFWEIFERGRKWDRGEGWHDEWPAWASFTASTGDNPHNPPDEIEELRKELPELAFRQEIEAQFLDGSGTVFRNVLACSTATAQDGPVAGHEYVMGVDFARSGDYTCAAVFDLATADIVHLDRFTGIEFALQRDRLIALADRFGVGAAVVETNFQQANFEELTRRDSRFVGFTTTAQSKPLLVDRLAWYLEKKDIGILSDPNLQRELLAFEGHKTPSGHIRYCAPSGQHDDCVIAAALAVFAAEKSFGDRARSAPPLW